MVSDHDRIFEQNRQRLRRLAYRLLGSLADADDMVQDVYVRWQRAGVGELRAPEAWLTQEARASLQRLANRPLPSP